MTRTRLAAGLAALLALTPASHSLARMQQPPSHNTGAAGATGYHAEPVTVGLGTEARAVLKGADPKLTASFKLTQEAKGVHIVGDVAGATPGKHGLTIRAKGLCAAPFTNVGPTFDPYQVPHGCPPNAVRALGDLGNVEIKADGKGHFDQVIDKISLVDPHHLVVGKAMTLQAAEDDCKTPAPGTSGAPIACGVITLAK